MQPSLKNLLDFIDFSHQIRQVKRSMWVKDEEQFENDAEHCYQIALVSMFVIEENRLELDVFRAMGMAMVHDIVEVHAGDTPVYENSNYAKTKYEREAAAIKKLKADWPQLKLLHSLIDEFESKQTKESKLVSALDKLVPILNNISDYGRNWKRNDIKLDDVIRIKNGKADIDPTVKKYYEQTLDYLREHMELFGSSK